MELYLLCVVKFRVISTNIADIFFEAIGCFKNVLLIFGNNCKYYCFVCYLNSVEHVCMVIQIKFDKQAVYQDYTGCLY